MLLALLGLGGAATAKETAPALIARCSKAYSTAWSLDVSFSMSGKMGTTSGTFKCAGRKFAFVTGMASSWFNGRDMWTYNPRTNETSIITPDAEEIAQNNPFAVIMSMSQNFNAAYAKNQPTGSIVVVLLPKSAKSQIKKVLLTLDAKRCVPQKIVINDASGTTTVSVKRFAANTAVAASAFEYPKGKYPRVKVVDLR